MKIHLKETEAKFEQILKEILLELEHKGRKITMKEQKRTEESGETTAWKDRLGGHFTNRFQKESRVTAAGVIRK